MLGIHTSSTTTNECEVHLYHLFVALLPRYQTAQQRPKWPIGPIAWPRLFWAQVSDWTSVRLDSAMLRWMLHVLNCDLETKEAEMFVLVPKMRVLNIVPKPKLPLQLKACLPHWTKGGIVGKSLKTTSRQNPTKQRSMDCLLQKRMSSSCS